MYLFIWLPRSHSSRKLRTLLEHYRFLVLLILHLRHCLQWTFRRNPVYASIAHSSLGSSVVRVRQVPNSFLDVTRKSKINFKAISKYRSTVDLQNRFCYVNIPCIPSIWTRCIWWRSTWWVVVCRAARSLSCVCLPLRRMNLSSIFFHHKLN